MPFLTCNRVSMPSVRRGISVLLAMLSFCYLNAQTLPSDLPGLITWYSADSVLIEDGGVSLWYDRSGNGNHAVQLVAASRPIVNPSEPSINGNPTLDFDGVNDFMLLDPVIPVAHGFVIASYGLTAFDVTDGLLTGQTGGSSVALFRGSAGTTSLANNGIFGNNIQNNGQTTLDFNPLEQYHLYSGFRLTSTNTNMTVGRDRNLTANCWEGSIAEVVLYSSMLDEVQRGQIIDYLLSKYGKMVDLGPDIAVENSLCPITLDAGDGFSSYLWSDGSEESSIEVTSSGEYSVTVTDVFGRSSSDTILVSYPTVQLESFLLCSGQDSLWDTGLGVDNYTFQWSDGSQANALLMTEGGEYYYTAEDTAGCSFYSDTITITEDFFPTSATLGPDIDLCSGNSIGFVSGSNEVVSAIWNETTAGLEYVVETSGTYTVEAINENNCVARDTIEVNIIGEAPIASFSFENTCLGESTIFQDTSIPLGTSFISDVSWEFGDGGLGNGAMVDYTFTMADTFLVHLSVTTDVGCEAFFSQNVIITPYPVAAMDFDVLCNDKLVTFYDESSVYQGAVVQQDWLFDNIDFISGNEALYLFEEVGTYPVRLIVTTEGGCRDTLIQNVFVNGSPISNFTAAAVCLGDPMLFSATPDETLSGPIQSFLWDFEGISNIFETTTFTWFTPGPHFVELTVTSALGCSDDTLMTVFVSNDPSGGFSDNAACFGQPIVFIDTTLTSFGDEVVQWDWFFGSEGTSQEAQPSFQFGSPGTYNVALNVVTDAGCEDQVDRLVTIFPLPISQFSLDPLIGQPPFTPVFTNLSSGAEDYFWTFDFGQTSIEFEPMHAFTDSGFVLIDLLVTNEFGCTDLSSQSILLTALQTDLVLLEVDFEQNGDFISPIVTVRNLSNYRVDDFTIEAEIAEGTTLQEHYSVPLAPDEIRQIDMSSSLFFTEGFGLPYLCIRLIPPSNRADLHPDDNRECIPLGLPSEEVYWLDPSPNPVGSILTIGLANSGDGVLIAEIYNALGEEALNRTYNVGSSFVEEFSLDVSGLTPGRYILRLSLGLEEKTYRIQVLRD